MPKNKGRVSGDNFSENIVKNLEKAIQKLEQYTDNQIKLNNSIDKSLTNQIKMQKEINKQHQKETERIEKNIKERDKEHRRTKVLQQFEKDFQLETSERSKFEIQNQQKLNKIREDAIKQVNDLRIGDTKRQKILKDSIQKYKEEQKFQSTQKGLMSFFGISDQNIRDIEDNTYLWKTITKSFSEAVSIFSKSVKDSIDKNYNTTEQTLNSITASNRMSWNSGSFTAFGKTYTGYSKINNAIKDQLSKDNLYDNIAVTDVIESASKLTSQEGLEAGQAIEKGFQDTVIKYIIPYLDTTSEAFTNVEYLMPRNF